MEYRRQIDGLRSVAILPVMLFHAGVPVLGGGYVGVDVFFVISGFLITSLLLEDLRAGRYSILHFYERRARRILPALFAMMAVTMVAGVLLMNPRELRELGVSALSVIAFVSNVFFFLDTGYFATAAEEKPFLHTWSLAVEEQYYLLFPLVLAGLHRLRAKTSTMVLVLGAVSVLSLLASHALSWRASAANFYLIPTRAWELLAGSLLALLGLHPSRLPAWAAQVTTLAGAALLAVSMLTFNAQTPFPSLYALLPVGGAALLIAGADSRSWVGRLLGTRPMVGIGLISYSLYLWHQPLLALLRMKTVGSPSVWAIAAMLLATFALAWLSWRFVERPFRDARRMPARQILVWSLGGATVLGTGAALAIGSGGWPGRYDTPSLEASMQPSPTRARCHTQGVDFLPPSRACTTPAGPPSWAVLGDSHVVELGHALGQALQPAGQGVLSLSFSSCPPALLFEARTPGCSRWTQQAVDWLERTASIRSVLVGYRHSAYLFGDQLARYPDVPDLPPEFVATSSQPAGDAQALRDLYWRSHAEIIRRLQAAGKTVYVLQPIPELPVDIHKAASPRSIFADRTLLDLEATTPETYYRRRHEMALARLAALPAGDRLVQVKPQDLLCGRGHCRAAIDGQAMYFDDDHLSVAGATLLVRRFLPSPP